MKPPRSKPYLSYPIKMHPRKRTRSVRANAQHHKYAFLLPLVVAMLFAGHLPDAADGKAIAAPNGKNLLSTVVHRARDSSTADAANEKHEWKATDTSDAPELPSLPQRNPSKRAPPPPAPSQTTRADDVGGTTTAAAPPPNMMMMKAVEAEGSHHYPAYFDEAKEKQNLLWAKQGHFPGSHAGRFFDKPSSKSSGGGGNYKSSGGGRGNYGNRPKKGKGGSGKGGGRGKGRGRGRGGGNHDKDKEGSSGD
jgi:hypothetical protein